MTVSTTSSKKLHDGNGVTVTFAYDFRILDETHLQVYVDSGAGYVLQTLSTHYSVTGVGSAGGGTVVFVTAPVSGTENVLLVRVVSLTQLADYVPNDSFPAETHEDALDKLTMIAQQIVDQTSRSFKAPLFEATDQILSEAVWELRANKYLGFDGSGGLTLLAAIDPTLYTVTAFAQTLLDDATANAFLTTLTATRAETGASAVPVLTKLRDQVHLRDFGAALDGTTDDTTAITNAIAALTNGGTLRYSGTPLISSTITIDKKIRLVADGAAGAGSLQLPASYFKKAASLNGDAIAITAPGVIMEGGGVSGVTGNGGDGIAILAKGVRLYDVMVHNMGNDGFSVGDPSAATDCNYWHLTNCYGYGNGRDGLHIESNTAGAQNANAGIVDGGQYDENTRDGIRNAAGHTNQFINTNGSGNGEYGLRIENAEYPVIIGGDYESNTGDGTHQIYITNECVIPEIWGLRAEFKVRDESVTGAGHPFNLLPKRMDQFVYFDMEWQPVLSGSSTAAKAVTSISRSGTTVTFNITGHGYAVGEAFAIEDTGTLFDGGYIVATVATADQITATVSSTRAGKLPASANGGNAYLGYDATPTGHWTRIGDSVFYQGNIVADNVALDGTITGNAIIRGFPFPAENVSAKFCTLSIYYGDVDLPAGTTQMSGYVSPNGYFITLQGCGDNVAAANIPVGATGVKITSGITISGFYRATPYAP